MNIGVKIGGGVMNFRGFFAAVILAAGALAGLAPAARATAVILVNQCEEFQPCWSGPGPTPWSATITGAQLRSIGPVAPLIVAQMSEYTMHLGETTMTFTTPGGPVSETVNGLDTFEFLLNPCNFCLVDTLGAFVIPADATSATLFGLYGDMSGSTYPAGGYPFIGSRTTAAVNLYLGAAPTPEPGAWMLVLAGVAGVGAGLRRAQSRARFTKRAV